MSKAEILEGDALTMLRTLDSASVQCVVTSPPYWGLRDYGVAGQLGLEATPDLYVAAMVAVFHEARRVLRKDGTLWLNLGDSYASGGRGGGVSGPAGEKQRSNHGALMGPKKAPQGLKDKDLVGIPWRVAFALQADGWWLRSDIIWAKPNPMPESVRDRPTRSHEYLFLLARSGNPTIWRAKDTGEWSSTPDFSERIMVDVDGFPEEQSRWRAFSYYYDADAIAEPGTYAGPNGAQHSPHGQGFTRRTPEEEAARQDKQRGHGRRHAGFNDRWDQMERAEQCSMMRNARSVWTIATHPYPEAHFATFPPELARRCIAAGTRPGDLVLDPFAGAGTTLLVAHRLGRDSLGIELGPAYCAMARDRIRADAPLLVST